MNPRAREFVLRTLTAASSHPHFARQRARFMLRLGSGFLLVCLATLIWHAAHLDAAWLFAVLRGDSWLAIAAYLLAVALAAFIATGVLVARVSVTGALPAPGTAASIPPAAYGVALLGTAAAGALLIFLPDLLPAGPAATRLRQASVVVVLLPYIITLVFLEFLPADPAAGAPALRRRPLWFWLAAATGLLTALFAAASLDPAWARRLATLPLIREFPGLGAWLQQFTGALLQDALRLLAAILLLPTLWLLGEWTLSGIPGGPPPSTANPSATPTAPRTRWQRLITLLRRILFLDPPAGTPQDTATEAPDTPPEWLQNLLDQSPPPPGVLGFELRPLVPPGPRHHTCELSPDDRHDLLFAGVRPSRDQLDAVLHFIQSHQQLSTPEGLPAPDRTADFLVAGPPASGKTDVLAACAVFAAVVRGERACLLVPDPASIADLRTRLDRILRFSGLHTLVRVGTFPLPPDAGPDAPERFPDLLVTTPEAAETGWFGPARQPLLAAGTTLVLVDDLASPRWTAPQTLHLPFLIDKLRLLLAAHQRRLQVVVATRPLPPAAREAIGQRLFASATGAAVRPHTQTLRPWRTPPARQVRVLADDIPAALASCARVCRAAGLNPLLFLEDASDEARRALTHRLEFTSPGADASPLPAPAVIAHLYETTPGTGSPWPVVIHRSSRGGDLVPSLAARFGDVATVYLEITLSTNRAADIPVGDQPTGKPPVPGPSEPASHTVFPLLPSQFAPALQVAHLRAAAGLLPESTPFPREALTTFGLPSVGNTPHTAAPPTAPDVGAWPRFAIDPPDTAPAPNPDPAGIQPWPMASLLPGTEARPVDPDALLDHRLGVRLAGTSGVRLETGPFTDAPPENRLAWWYDARGVRLGSTDLTLLGTLRFRRGDHTYWPARIQRDAAGLCRIDAAFWHGDSHEACLPVLDLRLEPPAGSRLIVQGPRLGGQEHLHWVHLHWEPAPSTSTPDAPPANPSPPAPPAPARLPTPCHPVSRLTLHGAAPESGRVTRAANPVTIDYACAVSVLLLRPNPFPAGDLQAFLTPLLDGFWDTGIPAAPNRPFWPELTAALQETLSRLVPRMGDFAHALAFRSPPELGGAAILWVEPLATARTADQFILALLDDAALCQDFTQGLQAALVRPGVPPRSYGPPAPLDPDQARALVASLGANQKPVSLALPNAADRAS